MARPSTSPSAHVEDNTVVNVPAALAPVKPGTEEVTSAETPVGYTPYTLGAFSQATGMDTGSPFFPISQLRPIHDLFGTTPRAQLADALTEVPTHLSRTLGQHLVDFADEPGQALLTNAQEAKASDAATTELPLVCSGQAPGPKQAKGGKKGGLRKKVRKARRRKNHKKACRGNRPR